jgi:hypothetical protein
LIGTEAAESRGGQISIKHLTTSTQHFFATCRLPRLHKFRRCYRNRHTLVREYITAIFIAVRGTSLSKWIDVYKKLFCIYALVDSCVAHLQQAMLMNFLSTLHSLSQSTYRVEMKYRCICMASQGTYTATLYVMVVTRVIGGWCALCKHPPPPHQPGLIFPLLWEIHQKSAIATLCVL